EAGGEGGGLGKRRRRPNGCSRGGAERRDGDCGGKSAHRGLEKRRERCGVGKRRLCASGSPRRGGGHRSGILSHRGLEERRKRCVVGWIQQIRRNDSSSGSTEWGDGHCGGI